MKVEKALITDKRNKTACFTGHREIRYQDVNLQEDLKVILVDLINQGYLYFGAGGARGFDTLAAETVLELRKQYPQIYLILILPFKNQYGYEKGWSNQEIEKYVELKEKAQKVVYIQEKYSSGVYYKRNRHLVDFSSVCICYQYKETGGTAYTTKWAKSRGLKVINCI